MIADNGERSRLEQHGLPLRSSVSPNPPGNISPQLLNNVHQWGTELPALEHGTLVWRRRSTL